MQLYDSTVYSTRLCAGFFVNYPEKMHHNGSNGARVPNYAPKL